MHQRHIIDRVQFTLDLLPADAELLLPTMRWQLREMFKRRRLGELSPAEVAAMIAVMTANANCLCVADDTARASSDVFPSVVEHLGRPVLTVVRGGDDVCDCSDQFG